VQGNQVKHGRQSGLSEEASERLVRLYLEGAGYLVVSNTRYKIPVFIETRTFPQRQRVSYEADIVAINPVSGDRIWGEVKGWRSGVQKHHFAALWKQRNRGKEANQWQRTMKIFNNPALRNQLRKAIEERYGSGFRLVLYCDHLKASDRVSILAHAEKGNFRIVEMREILAHLMRVKDEQAYSNDPVLQLLRIMERQRMFPD